MTDISGGVDFKALAADRAEDETAWQHTQRLLQERDEARGVARGLFWGEISPERIEAVTLRVKGWLRLAPDSYLAWLED